MSQEPALDFSFVLASSVHDMKNSLSMLLHSLDEICLELSEQNEPVANRIATIQYEAARVNNDLIRLLSLYKIDQDLLSPNIDEHSILDLLEEEVARYQPLFQARRVDCELDCDPELFGFFDRELVAGVIGNVLANTVRYARARIRLSAREYATGGVSIVVEDDGQGFPKRMLEPAPISASPTDFDSGSTNLGLYFARRIAEIHHQKALSGSIELANGSALGGGIFTLNLP